MNKLMFLRMVLTGILFYSSGLTVFAVNGLKKIDGLKNDVYLYRDTVKNIDGRGSMNAPVFMIYPDTPCNEEQAGKLISDLGLDELVTSYAGSAGIINPVGNTYDNKEDLEAYKSFINRMRVISNLKIIGIGKGASFVNDVISQHAYEVAGIFIYGGTSSIKKAGDIPVPAYISGGNKSLAALYARANNAVEVGRDAGHIYYANNEEPLQQVVLNLDKKVTLKEALADAWTTLFSKNYRFSNYRHTTYMGAKFGQYGNYELEPYLVPDALGVIRKTVKKVLAENKQPGSGTYFWYEFMPQSVVDAPAQSVPLLLMLHGNYNDNRTQSETGGFIEVAAKENFMVAEIEWQGAGAFPSDIFLGLDGIELVACEVMKNYPQIDPSRVYVQGLSAGAMASAALGIRKSHLFAAVGGHSGGIFEFPLYGFSYQTICNEARQKRGFVQTPYFLITGTDDDTILFPTEANCKGNPYFNAIHAYQLLNDMPKSEIDFSAEPLFGIKMQDRQTILTNKHLILETGKFYKDNMPLIQFTAVMNYGHWNFRPAAQMMWDFFKQYSRDPETGKLIYHETEK